MELIHINSPPTIKTIETPIERRYCFNCRKIRYFSMISRFAEWYGWSHETICENGHVDGDMGFGRSRYYEDE